MAMSKNLKAFKTFILIIVGFSLAIFLIIFFVLIQPGNPNITVANKTFSLPNYNHWQSASDELGGVTFYISDLKQGIPLQVVSPSAVENELRIILVPFIATKNKSPLDSQRLIYLQKEAEIYEIKNMKYIGSNKYSNYFFDEKENSYMECGASTFLPDLNPGCQRTVRLDKDVSIKIGFSRRYLPEVEKITSGVKVLLSNAEVMDKAVTKPNKNF